MKTRRLFAIVLLLALLAGGCTSIFDPISANKLGDSEELEQGKRGEIVQIASAFERLALRSVLDSSYYQNISDSVLEGSRPEIVRLSNRYMVVISLESGEKETRNSGMAVCPYVVFIGDAVTRELVEVVRVSPELDSRTLVIESFTHGDSSSTMPMEPEVAERLLQLRGEFEEARMDRIRALPKIPCDPSLTEPEYNCWWVTTPGYFTQPDYSICLADCYLACAYHPEACIGYMAACAYIHWNPAVEEWDCYWTYPCVQ